MYKHFIGVWSIYWLAVAFLPVKSIYPATIEAFILQLGFVALVSISYGLADFILKSKKLPEAGCFEIPRAYALIKLALGVSIVGFVFLIYDKIYIQEINYFEGLAVAREQWRQLGEERAGQASSIFSVMGYLFGSAYYVAAVLAVTQIKILSASQRIFILIACFFLVMGNSLITGGRSNILLLSGFVIGAMTSRGGLDFRKLSGGNVQRWIIILATGLAASYTIFIFYQRADASDLGGMEYVLDFLPYLGLEMNGWYKGLLDEGVLSSISAMLVLAVSYVTHSFSSTAAIIDGPIEDKTIIFSHIVNLLSRLGFVNYFDDEWFLAGRFPSVPGALWHQFGFAGFSIGSVVLGAVCATARAWTAQKPTELLPLGVFVMLYVVLILTPLLFAGDFLSFPFVAAAFLLLAVVGKFLRQDITPECLSPNDCC